MGSCLSRRNPHSGSGSNVSNSQSLRTGQASNVTVGKNKPLHSEKQWKSETPITMGQLRSKRDEYWETQPAFEGRREIWDALHAACTACETNDLTLAQAIVDGANITLPTGSLSDAYDELGNHYVIPIYCISLPTNLIQSDDPSGHAASSSNSKENIPEQDLGEEIPIKVRLSTTNKDTKMIVRTGETILSLKRRIHEEHKVPPSKQRLFFAGKLLYDKLKFSDTKISKGFVVQVIVASEE